MLKHHDKKDLSTFSAVYRKGEKADESRYIREYQGVLANMHFTWPSAESLLKDRESFVRAHGEPVPSTAPYAHYKVMELASKKVVVTLDGQGADEQLAGYHYFFGFYFLELLRKFRLIRLLSEVLGYRRIHHSSYGLKTLAFFMLPASLKNSARVGEKNYLSRDFIREFSGRNTIVSGLYASPNLQEALLDHFEYKLEHLLKWEDRNSMWFSLESRVPFLDYRLVEKTLSLPSGWIIRQGTTKHILREAMKGILPEPIRKRPDKIGFLTPEDSWFREPYFREFIQDIISSKTFLEREFFDAGKVKRRLEKHLSGQVNISKEIWKWIHLEMWFRMFIDPSVSGMKSVH
jgi:asparagine synthase (glutamine-hydrolysing)